MNNKNIKSCKKNIDIIEMGCYYIVTNKRYNRIEKRRSEEKHTGEASPPVRSRAVRVDGICTDWKILRSWKILRVNVTPHLKN